ncbi:YraN family protein [Candidatus Parcubacteria bacterium]|nr:YraN family protein [Candidatus Parcubacteria bacterium]
MDNRTEKRIVGDRGEDIACEFLVKQGFLIKDRNYLRKYGEIDIVSVKDRTYHFIEVKTVSCLSIEALAKVDETVSRRTFDGYRPEDNVHPWKLKRLSRVIQAYILDKRLWDIDWIFDIVTVYIDKKTGESAIRLIEDIVL